MAAREGGTGIHRVCGGSHGALQLPGNMKFTFLIWILF